MLGPKGPRHHVLIVEDQQCRAKRRCNGIFNKSLSDDLLYHLDEKNKYNIAELSTEMLSKFESIF